MATPLDEWFRAMADQTRRRILVALLEHNPQSEIALHPIDDVEISNMESERLTSEMYHLHLPMLEESGLINWDRETHEVRKGEHFDEIRPFLSILRDNSNSIAKPA